MSNSKENTNPVEITELVLRDGHQSLFATRMRIDDMLPIAEKLDRSATGRWNPGVVPLLILVFAF